LLAIDLLSFSLHRTGWSRFASTFLLFVAQIVTTEFVLGLFSALAGLSLVALNATVSGYLILVLWRRFGSKLFPAYVAALRRSIASGWAELQHDPLSLTVVVLALGFLGWIVFLGVLFPSIDYDGNSYHLTFIGNLIQNHTFFDAPSSSP